MVERRRVDRGVHPTRREQRRQGGGEAEPARDRRVVKRLDAQAVAAEQHAPAVALPDREREHAVEAADEVLAPGVIGLEQHLGVAVGVEAVALGLELAAQLGVVVDRAVENDAQPQRRIEHRLLGGLGQIHDLQPAMAPGLRALRKYAATVRAARLLLRVHARQSRKVRGGVIESQLTCNSTH